MARFEYFAPGSDSSQSMPRLPMEISVGGRSIRVEGLVDTGAAVSVLPYNYGLALGVVWEKQNVALSLTGALAEHEARAIFLLATNSQVTGPSPVQLAFAWTRKPDLPVIFGQTNFLMEFNVCFYRSQNFFEVWRS